jgi:hypothetical protein
MLRCAWRCWVELVSWNYLVARQFLTNRVTCVAPTTPEIPATLYSAVSEPEHVENSELVHWRTLVILEVVTTFKSVIFGGSIVTTLKNSRLPQWTAPPRPEWVKRLNQEGNSLDLSGVVPLDERSLIDRAIANTGLSDFGKDDWREPFRVLVQGLDSEAQLNLMGRLLTRSDLLMFLEARLRVENAYRQHPEIEDEQIERPLWVIGQGRSGTTLLHTLLAQPPANRTTTDGEALFPVPLPGVSAAQQREIADARITQWTRVRPEVASIHEFGVDKPCETFRIEAMAFRAAAWLNLLGLAPSYNMYMAQQASQTTSLEYARRVCKLLQWKKPKRQWVLRSNDSILYLAEVLKVFPDARIIWSHRDPIRAMASMVDMIGTMMSIRSDQKMVAAYEQITDPVLTAATLSGPIDLIESGVIPRNQIFSVQYSDLVRDSVGTVAKIYDYYGLDFTSETRKAISDYVTAHPRTKRPAHRYAIGSEEQIRAERAAFKRYQDYFGVPNES